MHVFGKGMIDTLDDAFWMLPFSGKKQSQIIQQENDLTDDDWHKRRNQITAEHRLEGASLEPSGRHGSSKMPSRLAARRDQGLRPPTKESRNTMSSFSGIFSYICSKFTETYLLYSKFSWEPDDLRTCTLYLKLYLKFICLV